MITVVRRGTQGPVFKILILVVLACMLGAGMLTYFFGDTSKTGPWLMKVNGQKVTIEMYEQQRDQLHMQLAMYAQQLEKQLGAQGRQFVEQMLSNINIEERTMNALADRIIVGELAGQLRITVPQAAVKESLEQQFQQMPGLVDANGRVNPQMLKRYTGFASVGTFENMIESTMRNGQIMEFIDAGVYLPEFMIKNHYAKEFSKKNYGTVRVSLDQFLKDEQKNGLTDKEIVTYFDKHNRQSKRYWTPESRTATLWEFSPTTSGVKVSDKEVDRYYKDKKHSQFAIAPAAIEARMIVLPFDEKNPNESRRVAQKAYDDLKESPKTFADTAKRISIDADSAKNGGRIKPVTRDNPTHNLSQEAFKLKNDGDIAAPFKTDAGLTILQRTGKTKAQYKKLADVKPEIVKTIQEKKFNENFPKISRKMIRQHRDGVKDAVSGFADRKNGVRKSLSEKTGEKTGIRTTKLFSLKKEGATDSYLDDGKGYVVQLDTLTKSSEPALASVKRVVIDDVHHDRARTTLEARLNEAKQFGGKKLAEFASQHGLSYKTTGMISLKDTEAVQKLAQEQEIPVQELAGLDRIGAVKAASSAKSGVVMTLIDQEPFDAAGYDQARAAIINSLNQEQKSLIQQGFIASLFRNATIDMNTKVSHNQRR